MALNIQTAHQIDALKRTDDVKLETSNNVDFSHMMLAPHVLKGLNNAGFVKPSPIQLEAIPVGRCGLDLIVQAKSGTGKTCVFTIIALESVNIESNVVQILILAPTREIVVQIADVINSVGSAMPNLRCCTFIGGISIAMDKVNIRQCHIAVGTPGRVKQLIKDKLLNTSAVRLFVLDEADKLLEESFQKDINWIYHHLPSTKQMIALSATYPEELAQFLTRYMQSPVFIRLNAKNPALLGIKQFYRKTSFHPLQQKSFENKIPEIVDILSHLQFGQCLIFSNYQIRANILCDLLTARGWPATCICGKMDQNQRLMVMAQMKQFQCRVLVSTDLTARGIDVYNVNVVINLDVPYDLETYLHRIGRAGRFGSYGIAITLASEGEEERLLEKLKNSGNLQIKQLPELINSDLWNLDTVDKLLSPINSSDDVERKCLNDCNIEQNKNQHFVFGADAAVGAGHIELWKHKENIRKEKLGKQHRSEDKNCAISHNKIVKDATTDVTDFNIAATQLLNDTFPIQNRLNTFSEDERDQLEFLKTIQEGSKCDVCSDALNTKKSARSKEAVDKLSSHDFEVISNETFFHDLKNDLKSVLEFESNEELKNTLDSLMSNLRLEDDVQSESQHNTQSKGLQTLDVPNVTPTTVIKLKQPTLKKMKEHVAMKKPQSLEYRHAKEMRENYIPHVFHAKAENCESPTNIQTSNKYRQPHSEVYSHSLNGQFNHTDFNEWQSSIRAKKYFVWYKEYTKYMLNHR
ncbi:DEAD (Asp-Glu-Ala-Asp) box polypeptide 20 [Chamberlinius hualienensis]